MRLKTFFKILFGIPDFKVGIYINRWFLTDRREEGENHYLHQFLNDDDDRANHDHPWDSVSFVLWGGYIEHISGPHYSRITWDQEGQFYIDGKPVRREETESRTVVRKRGDVIFRRAEHTHRIELFKDSKGRPKRAWTLFITGPKIREWGFECPKGWVHHKDFVDRDNEGNVGKGCPE